MDLVFVVFYNKNNFCDLNKRPQFISLGLVITSF